RVGGVTGVADDRDPIEIKMFYIERYEAAAVTACRDQPARKRECRECLGKEPRIRDGFEHDVNTSPIGNPSELVGESLRPVSGARRRLGPGRKCPLLRPPWRGDTLPPEPPHCRDRQLLPSPAPIRPASPGRGRGAA